MEQLIPAHIQVVWDRGDKVHAIKLLREATPGLGLAEAKELLESGPSTASSPRPFGVQSLPASVLAALESGNKIEAIKLLRQATGLGLKEAKDWVDATEVDRQRTKAGPARGYALGEVPRGSNRLAVLLLVITAIVVAVWFYFNAG